MKKFSHLILVLAFLLAGCKTQHQNKPFDWAGHSCLFTGTYDAPGILESYYPPEYTGTFRCTNPDGSHLTCPYTNQPVGRAEFSTRVQFPTQITEENFWASFGCRRPSATSATPLPTATPQPTATSTTVPTATLVPAFLSGKVTACNLTDRFINFELATISPLVSESDVVLMLNNIRVPCSFAGNDNSLLSCSLPAGVTFPAQIHVTVANASTDDFSYDGAGCVTSAPTTDGSNDGGTDPAPTACTGDCP